MLIETSKMTTVYLNKNHIVMKLVNGRKESLKDMVRDYLIWKLKKVYSKRES